MFIIKNVSSTGILKRKHQLQAHHPRALILGHITFHFFLCISLRFEIILHIVFTVDLYFLTLSIHPSTQHTFSPKYLKVLFNGIPDYFSMILGSLYKHHLPSQKVCAFCILKYIDKVVSRSTLPISTPDSSF